MSISAAVKNRLSQVPIFSNLQLQLDTANEGVAKLIAPYDPAYGGVLHSFHGGLLMTLADTASCVAVLTLAGADAVITTTEMNIRFLACCHSDATAEAIVVKFGKSLCRVSVHIRDEKGIYVAMAQITHMRLGKM